MSGEQDFIIGIYKVQLPKITPHVCRYTFCSNMAKSGMNPKTLQYHGALRYQRNPQHLLSRGL